MRAAPDSPAAPGRRPGGFRLGLQARIGMVLVFAGLGAIATAIAVRESQQRQVSLLVAERGEETARVVRRVVELRAHTGASHADDYTRWDEFVEFTRRPSERWATINIDDNLATFHLDAAWVLDRRHRLLWSANPGAYPELEALPVSARDLARALEQGPIRHFHVRTSAGLLEVWTSSIQPSDDMERRQPPSGYYVVGRLWDPEWVQETAHAVGGTLELEPAGTLPAGARSRSDNGDITVAIDMPGLDGAPVSQLVYRTSYPLAEKMNESTRLTLVLMVGAGLFALVLVWSAMSHWVGRPLAAIEKALRTEDVASLGPVESSTTEVGRLARLVHEFFTQRAELVVAREQAEEATRAKSRFLASTSHELRTPMHGILSYARFGTRGAMVDEREDLREQFRQIEDCGKTLLTMLNNLLDLSKFEAGRMRIAVEDVRLQEVCSQAVDEFRSLFHERRVEVHEQVPEDLPLVRGDQLKLLQVVRNLLSNAAKFTPPGGDVHVTAEAIPAGVRLCVEDSGIGIPESELDRVFEMFEQASNTARRGGGTGIGLALCREIVTGHGGRIWAESDRGSGTRMVFELPLDGVPEDRRAQGESSPGESERTAA